MPSKSTPEDSVAKETIAAPVKAEIPEGIFPEGIMSIESHHQSLVISQGPLPPPEDLERYEKILPGMADRLLVQVEKQAAHRQLKEMNESNAEIEDKKSERTERRWGQILGFLIALFFLIAGIVIILLRTQITAQIVGGLLGSGGLTGLVTVFVYGRKQEKLNEDDEK